MLVQRPLVSIGTVHFASALCWWLVAVVGKLTSPFLVTSLLSFVEKPPRVRRVGGYRILVSVAMCAFQHSTVAGGVARSLALARRSLCRSCALRRGGALTTTTAPTAAIGHRKKSDSHRNFCERTPPSVWVCCDRGVGLLRSWCGFAAIVVWVCCDCDVGLLRS